MVDNTEEEALSHIKDITEQNLNHLVRHDGEIKGIVNIEARTDGSFNIKLHTGTEREATVIEGVSKEELIGMMEEQL